MVLIVVTAMLVAAGPAAATHVTPAELEGNPTCASVDSSWIELKVDAPAADVFSDGTLEVTVSGYDGVFLDWASDIGVDAVLVKGGPGANLYRYDPPAEATEDEGLHAPINPANGQPYDVSHISFCYDLGGSTETREASVSVAPGACVFDGVPGTPVTVTINPAGAASVAITGEGFDEIFTGSGGEILVSPGDYGWAATPGEGFTLTGATTGEFTAADCTPQPSVGSGGAQPTVQVLPRKILAQTGPVGLGSLTLAGFAFVAVGLLLVAGRVPRTAMRARKHRVGSNS